MPAWQELTSRRAPLLWSAWLVAVLSLVAQIRSLSPVEPLSETPGFVEAAEYLERQAGAGTFVVVWPPEQAAALAALPASLAAADAVPVEPFDKRRYLHILVVGPLGFSTPPELAGATLGERRRFAGVEVGSFTWAASDRVDFDLRASLADVRIYLRGREHNVECNAARPGGGWSCPGRPPWNHVAPTHLSVEGHDWPSVWAHPVGGHELVLDLGERHLWDRIEVESALADAAASSPAGASVVLQLEVSGAGTRRLSRTNRPGIARTSLPTKRGSTAHVRLRVTTANDSRRHLGINLRIVEAR
jgi:hypothetical protein